MRRIIDYANFGANHVGGMGSRRAAVCCIHLLPSSRSRARSLPVCLSFLLSARALSFHLALLLLLLLALSCSFSHSRTFSRSHSLSLSLFEERSTFQRIESDLCQRCQLALRGRRSEFRRAKKGLKKCHYSRTYQTELSQKRNRVKSEPVSNCLKSETMK